MPITIQKAGCHNGRAGMIRQDLIELRAADRQYPAQIPRGEAHESINQAERGHPKGCFERCQVSRQVKQQDQNTGNRKPCQQVKRNPVYRAENRMHDEASRSSFGVDVPANVPQDTPAVPSTVDWSNIASGGLLDKIRAWAGVVKNLKDCNDLIVNYSRWIPTLGQRYDAIKAQWSGVDSDASQAFAYSYGTMKSDWDAAVATVQPELAVNGASETVAAASEYAALIAAAEKFSDLEKQLGSEARALGIDLGTLPSYDPIVQPPVDSSSSFLKNTSGGIPGALNALGATLAGGNAPPGFNPLDNPWVKAGLIVGAIGVVGYTAGQLANLGSLAKAVSHK